MNTPGFATILLATVWFALSGCSLFYRPPSSVEKRDTWEGEAYQVGLLSQKHLVKGQTNRIPASAILVDNGKHWRYELKGISFEFGEMLGRKAPMTRKSWDRRKIGHTESITILVDKRFHPLPPAPYRNRRIRVTGTLRWGDVFHPIDKGYLSPKSFPGQVFGVTVWTLETSPEAIVDLGPVAEGRRSVFPTPISDP